jgi:hypothetical protein
LEQANLPNIKSINFWIKIGIFFVFSSFALAILATNFADLDLWGYLSFGRLFWHSKNFPYQDVFAYVPTLNPWVYHEWLTGVLFYPIYQALGAPGLQVLKYSLGLTTMGLVYLTARRRGAHPLAAALFTTLIFTMARVGYISVLRAQVFTYFFFAVSLYALERARLSLRWHYLYLLPVIQLPWCNLHGGFLAGLGLIAIYAMGEFLARRPYRPYLGIFLLSLLVTLINPYGVHYWEYLARAVTMPRPYITEWASVWQSYQAGYTNAAPLIYLSVLCFMGLWGMWQSRWREVTASLALAITLFLAWRHCRHLPLFLILAGAYLPVCFQVNVNYLQSLPKLKRLWRQTNPKITVLAALVGLTILNFTLFINNNPFTLTLPDTSSNERMHYSLYYPVSAVNFINKQHLSGKILTEFGWGEYLIWELYPKCLVAFDGRYETVYPLEFSKRYVEFYYARPKWKNFLEDYSPDLILLDKKSKVTKLIKKESQWRPIYSDSGCVLFMACKTKIESSQRKMHTLKKNKVDSPDD